MMELLDMLVVGGVLAAVLVIIVIVAWNLEEDEEN